MHELVVIEIRKAGVKARGFISSKANRQIPVSNHIGMLRDRPNTLSIIRIDITAFTHVAIIIVVTLLIISMVAVNPHRGRGPTLPRVAHPLSMPGADRDDALVVFIARDGQIFVGNERVEGTLVLDRIKEKYNKSKERMLYVEADARVPYRFVSEVLGGARSAGIVQIVFLVEQRKAI